MVLYIVMSPSNSPCLNTLSTTIDSAKSKACNNISSTATWKKHFKYKGFYVATIQAEHLTPISN